MNFKFGRKGGKKIRDSELSEDSAGDDDVPAFMYETIAEGLCSVWSLTMPPEKEGVCVKVHDCRVSAGDSQSMSFAAAEDNPQQPWYDLDALWFDQPELDEQGVQKQTSKLNNSNGFLDTQRKLRARSQYFGSEACG